ncbi:tetratricopeptide repeat protein 32 isoform X2 [Amblyraja radiata]|uniref:tetratricopeptide repeat protein 32 isoform X2 n=1 Tax=Amblyraja radiata TaxID=386614 RepID=UPI0014026CDE|nr:tetratricopeptide repeat protein 32 isoform X2 [Amblyraja radiata]
MECRAVLAEANMQFQRQDLMRAEESYSRFIHMCRERQQRVLMSNMEEWCRQHYLNDNTINQLKHQVLFTREGINSLTRNDIENMNISLGQKTALRHLLCSENAQARMKQSKIPQTDYIDYGWIHNITELFILVTINLCWKIRQQNTSTERFFTVLKDITKSRFDVLN